MPKMGHALKRAVAVVPPKKEKDEVPRKITSALMNPIRRRIFQFLCGHPLSSAGTVANDLSISRATAYWHLEYLVESDYVDFFEYRKKTLFYPKGMISDDRAREIIMTIVDSKCNMLFKVITENQGADKNMLREFENVKSLMPTLRRIEDAGLISSVKDGRHIRYFPTGLLEETIKSETPRLKAFRRNIIKRVQDEHLRPTIKEIKGENLVIILNIFNKAEPYLITKWPAWHSGKIFNQAVFYVSINVFAGIAPA